MTIRSASGNGSGRKQDGVHYAEDCRIGPDAERKRERGGDEEALFLEQLADGEFEVLQQRFHWNLLGARVFRLVRNKREQGSFFLLEAVSGVGDTVWVYDTATLELIKTVYAGGDFMLPPVEIPNPTTSQE